MEIIAEVGSNWQSIEDCYHSIAMAKACGADVVKFQLFTGRELYGIDRDMAVSLPAEWVPKLAEKAEACGIEFMCTAFSPEGLAVVDPFVKRHKIASSDMCFPQLLDVSCETKKPLIVSTGGHSLADVADAHKYIADRVDVTWLYCESVYPAYCTDLRKLSYFKEHGLKYGLSDHSKELFSIPLMAQELGCSVLEKHVNFCEAKGPDAPHSLDLEQFRRMVKALRDPGDTPPLLSGEERDMGLRHNRRLMATADIATGEVLRYGVNFGAYRSLVDDARGLTPWIWDRHDGKPAARNYKRGEPIY